jgi:modulator of FtsH protease
MIDYTRPEDRQPRTSAAPPGYVAPPEPNRASSATADQHQPGSRQHANPRLSPWLDPDHGSPDGGLSYGALLSLTMALVAASLATMVVGCVVGGDLQPSTALTCVVAGIAMLLAQSFVAPLRHGVIGLAWLFALTFALGLGFGPVLTSYATISPDVVAEAAGMTGIIVLGAASYGTFTANDLARWMRPVSLAILVLVAISWTVHAAGSPTPLLISLGIGVLSAVGIVIDFNYLRRHADGSDVIWLATGIFVSIVNIFFTLMRLLSD